MYYLFILSDFYRQYALWINTIGAVFAIISAIRLFLYLRGKEKAGSRWLSALGALFTWTPFDDPVRDHKRAEEEHQEFLRKRKNRKPGHLTDEM